MASPRITYKGINLDLVMGKTGLKHIPKQKRNQNESASGKIETINQFGRFDYEFEAYFSEAIYHDLWAWWSWARQGKGFSFALDSTNVGHTKLDAAAAAAQKVIPVTTTSDFAVGDVCLIRADDEDNEFEIIEIASISSGVSITAVDNLNYGYTASALGSELVTNGGFPANTTGWTAGNAATLASIAGGKVGNCLRITCDGTNNPYAYQNIAVIPGDSHILQAYVKAGTEASYAVWLRDVTNGVNFWEPTATEETAGDWSTLIEKEFVVPSGCSILQISLIQFATAGATTTLLYDSVTLKKINADTLSHKDYFAKALTTEKQFKPTLTGVIDTTLKYYKHTFKFTENL